MAEANGRLKELTQRFVELRDKKRGLEQQVKDLQSELDLVGQELIPIMQDLDAQNIKLEGIGTVYLQSRFYVRPIAEKLEELMLWLDSNGLGHLAKRAVHHKTLESEYQNWIENDQVLPPAELLQTYSQTEVRIRKG